MQREKDAENCCIVSIPLKLKALTANSMIIELLQQRSLTPFLFYWVLLLVSVEERQKENKEEKRKGNSMMST